METFSQVMNWFFAVLALAALVIGYFLVKKRREGE
jgi:LPXTG-motif cell wall-anchored protein